VPGLRRHDSARAPSPGPAAPAARRRASRREVTAPPDAAELSVRLQARARRDEVVGERGGQVVIRVTAPPVDGRANDALCRLIAKAARIPPSKVAVVRGHTARDKVVRVEGIGLVALRTALGV
jgi:uncharacterized protein (TIGR00251 family)